MRKRSRTDLSATAKPPFANGRSRSRASIGRTTPETLPERRQSGRQSGRYRPGVRHSKTLSRGLSIRSISRLLSRTWLRRHLLSWRHHDGAGPVGLQQLNHAMASSLPVINKIAKAFGRRKSKFYVTGIQTDDPVSK